MAGIKRYRVIWGAGDFFEEPNGEWVKYEDILPAIKRAFNDGKKVGEDSERATQAYWSGPQGGNNR